MINYKIALVSFHHTNEWYVLQLLVDEFIVEGIVCCEKQPCGHLCLTVAS